MADKHSSGGPRFKLSFSSRLHISYRDELTDLFFYNPNQDSFADSIVKSIEQYGVPRLVQDQDFLRLSLDGGYEVQNLYALVERGGVAGLAGVAIFTRTGVDTIDLLHLAVKEEYAQGGEYSGDALVVMILGRLREIAHQIRGVRMIRLHYGQGSSQRIRVR